ncbi:MAG: translocation/assembly module TamB, partial [Pseudomonadota bacterium]
MKKFPTYILAFAMVVAAPISAQDDGATRLEQFLEDNLSGAGRSVTVRGFRGALSGRAELETLTIADANGVWLTLSDAALDWNRAALLRGRLEVAELSAAKIDFPRLPEAEDTAPSPEASGGTLSLPDLPVAIDIGRIAAETVEIGAPVLGQALRVNIDGTLRLDDGEGDVDIALNRIDGAEGRIGIGGRYSNTTEVLAVDVSFEEAAGGVAASLLGLPGAPALELTIAGEGPIDDFAADLSLATDGTDRFGGSFSTALEGTDRRFLADLSGDLSPLFDPTYQRFFGASSRLELSARRTGSQTTEVDRFAIRTAAVDLQGS